MEFKYTRKELSSYLTWRTAGLTYKSSIWLAKAASVFWEHTKGRISKDSLERMREALFSKYDDVYAHSKVLNFTKGFLKYQAKLTFDQRYLAFDLFLEKPKVRKVRKKMTGRIITKGDVERVLSHIQQETERGSLDELHAKQFSGLVLFGAYTGQRPYSTIGQLRVEQFQDAFRLEKPVVHVEPMQDKIRMEHYVPLHPAVVQGISACDPSRAGLQFAFESLRRWTKEAAIPLTRCASTFVPSDLRKFTEQHGDVIGWDQSNRAYILTHGVSGVDWAHYKHPLPEHVYDTYMRYWGDVRFSLS